MAPEDRANTRSIPISNKSMPPAVVSAASEIPRRASRASPNRANNNNSPEAMLTPRIAILLRSEEVFSAVRAANIIAESTGATVAKKVVKAMAAASSTGLVCE